MIRQLLFSFVVVAAGAGNTFAHHTNAAAPHTMATVRIAQGLMADGKPLPAGTYEVIITDERPATGAGDTDRQRIVEFVQNGTVVAREIAEVFAAGERPVGTSGSNGRAKAVVQTLRGGEFVRIAISDAGARYLIHLPVGSAGQ